MSASDWLAVRAQYVLDHTPPQGITLDLPSEESE